MSQPRIHPTVPAPRHAVPRAAVAHLFVHPAWHASRLHGDLVAKILGGRMAPSPATLPHSVKVST
jgi:hypothetical protein